MAEPLLQWALQPLSWALLAWTVSLLAGIGGRRVRWRQMAFVLGAIGCTLLWLLSTPRLSNALALWAERAPLATTCAASTSSSATRASWPIVVPGAGLNAWLDSEEPFQLLDRDSVSRTLRALQLDQGNTAFYVLGGGDNGHTVAGLMARVLRRAGVAPERIVEERGSRSTHENASMLRPLLPTDRPIRLVSSALHLPRARASFERAGYRVCTVSSGTLHSPSAGLVGWLPWLTGLTRSSEVARESFARLLYAL